VISIGDQKAGGEPRSEAAGKKSGGEQRAYVATPPRFAFSQLIVSEELEAALHTAVRVLRVEEQVFDTWGLRKVEPFPKSALNFFGPPGVGKTLAAHAIASELGIPIMEASYAEIESKYHGDGPKNVQALFRAAEEQGALLFIDEADSLLSKRLTNVTQGSEQAINSMRSQLLICLEQFHGVVVFSTNLAENYDRAFETRVRHVRFELPDAATRTRIWDMHLVPELPVAPDVDAAALAVEIDDVCGRDIKNAVIDAAVKAAVRGAPSLSQDDFVAAISAIKEARLDSDAEIGVVRPLSSEEKADLTDAIRSQLGDRGTESS
jgi:ATP-dependent 26S proteasome regulatory subunit